MRNAGAHRARCKSDVFGVSALVATICRHATGRRELSAGATQALAFGSKPYSKPGAWPLDSGPAGVPRQPKPLFGQRSSVRAKKKRWKNKELFGFGAGEEKREKDRSCNMPIAEGCNTPIAEGCNRPILAIFDNFRSVAISAQAMWLAAV